MASEKSGSVDGEYDVVVVGGGIMGSCTAYQVARRGATVLLLEQFDFLHRRGSSHGDTRTIRSTYPEPYYTLMMKQAFSLWHEAQEEIGYLVHTNTPHLDFGPNHSKSLMACLANCIQHNIPIHTLSSRQACDRFVGLSLPSDWMALLTEEGGGVIHASKAVAMFQALALKHGAVLRDRASVQRISTTSMSTPLRSGNGQDPAVWVHTNRGSAVGRKCVIAAGAWTPKLVQKMCGLSLPITPLHTTLAYWRIVEPEKGSPIQESETEICFGASSGFPSFACYSYPYIYGNASIELPGLLKVALHSGYKCDPDNRPLIPDMKALKDFVSPWLETHFKGKVLSNEPVLAEPCMYSMTPDQDFILDFLPMGDDNNAANAHKLVLVAGGFSGHGFKMGPLVGKILADLCLKGSCEDVPLHHFCISRFNQHPQGNVKDYEEQVTPFDNL